MLTMLKTKPFYFVQKEKKSAVDLNKGQNAAQA